MKSKIQIFPVSHISKRALLNHTIDWYVITRCSTYFALFLVTNFKKLVGKTLISPKINSRHELNQTGN